MSSKNFEKKEQIIIDLQRAFSKNKDTTIEKLIRLSGHTIPTILKYFGSTSKALEVSKIDLSKRISKDMLIDDFKIVCEKLGRIPTIKEIGGYCKHSHMTFIRNFGSIDNILKEAGIERPEQKIKISEDELLSELKNLYKKIGRTPTLQDVHEQCEFSGDTYQRVFGGFTQALQKIGLTPIVVKKVSSICFVCGVPSSRMIAHMKSNHSDELKKHEEFVVGLYKDGLSSRSIAARDDVIYNGGTSVNRLIKKYLTADEIEELRKSKIKNTLKEDYKSGKYDWVNELNRNRNTTEEAKKKNSDGLKIAYKSGKRKSWNEGLTKKTDERVAKAAKKTSESMKSLYQTGEIEKKIGPDNHKWNENREEVARRYRLGLDFSVSDRENIKKRAEFKCQSCGKAQDELNKLGLVLECDHITPITKGGSKNWEENGQALCAECHKEKTRLDLEDE